MTSYIATPSRPTRPRPARSRGFTWIELMFVVAVIGILALMAVPGMQENMVKKQVKEAMELADVAKKGIQLVYATTGEMPKNNNDAGIPQKHKIVGNLVKEVDVKDGAITLTFGNNSSKVIEDKKLTIRPAIVNGEKEVPIAWICHANTVPKGMEIRGAIETSIEMRYLPLECRGTAPK